MSALNPRHYALNLKPQTLPSNPQEGGKINPMRPVSPSWQVKMWDAIEVKPVVNASR